MREATLAALERAEDSDTGLYLFRLSLFHEDMHAEAFVDMRHTLGMPSPPLAGAGSPDGGACAGDVELRGRAFALGARVGAGFVFNNERWAHEVRIAPFAMSRRLVGNAEFAAFVDDGGYRRED